MYRSLLRTYPSDIYRISAVVELVKHFGWIYIGTMNIDDEYGKSSAAQFAAATETENICLAFHEIWPQFYERKDLLKLGESGDLCC